MKYDIKCQDCKTTILGSVELPEDMGEDFVLYQNRCDSCQAVLDQAQEQE